MSLLEGTSIKHLLSTKEGRASLIGKDVIYLTSADIDRSGRGYFFPRYGMIAGFSPRSREMAIDTPENYVAITSAVVEMVLRPESPVATVASEEGA